MRKRKSKIAMVACLIALAAVPNLLGQTWVNPNSGSWSVGANWLGGVAPVSSNDTRLRFDASGAQNYIATNDFAGPFLLNAMTFDAGGTSVIHVNGNPLAFGGAAPGITHSGTGAVVLSNTITLPTTGGVDAFPVSASNLTFAGQVQSAVAPTGQILSGKLGETCATRIGTRKRWQ